MRAYGWGWTRCFAIGLSACALAACGPGSGLRHGGAAAGGHGGADPGAGATGSAGASGTAGATGGAGANGGAGASGAAGVTADGGAGVNGSTGTDAAAGAGAAGTGTAGSGVAGAGGAGQTVFTFAQGLNRSVDVVFMVDDSFSMSPLQSKLTAAFPAYIQALKALPGGLPDIHIGVVSSSMGAGRDTGIDHCPQGGDQGMFHTMPLGGAPCMRASLNAGQNFIVDVGGQANYTGDISDVFACIAALGANGCGFEHQLESVARALGADGAPAPATNANFLRADALLQIILLTNEDDCSAPPDSDLFDSSSSMVSDPLGPMQSYRCNEFGHLCGGQMPPRQPAGETDLGMCVSNEMGKLIPVGDVITAFKALKTDPSRVLVSAITGPAAPYKVNVGPSQVQGDPAMWPFVEHSCTNTEPDNSVTYADPARAHQAVGRWVRHARPLPEPLRPQLHERPHVDRRAGRLRLRAAVLASDDRPEQVLVRRQPAWRDRPVHCRCVRARAARTPGPAGTRRSTRPLPAGREVVFNRLAGSACRRVDDGDLLAELGLDDPAAAGRQVRLVDVRDVVVLEDAGLVVFVLVVVASLICSEPERHEATAASSGSPTLRQSATASISSDSSSSSAPVGAVQASASRDGVERIDGVARARVRDLVPHRVGSGRFTHQPRSPSTLRSPVSRVSHRAPPSLENATTLHPPRGQGPPKNDRVL